MKIILSFYVNLLLKLSLSKSILITILTSRIQSGISVGPSTFKTYCASWRNMKYQKSAQCTQAGTEVLNLAKYKNVGVIVRKKEEEETHYLKRSFDIAFPKHPSMPLCQVIPMDNKFQPTQQLHARMMGQLYRTSKWSQWFEKCLSPTEPFFLLHFTTLYQNFFILHSVS